MRFNGQSLFTPGQIFGTRKNDDAGVGKVGEIIENTVLVASVVALSTGTAANVTSISLTPGDWNVFGNVAFDLNAATTLTQIIGAINTTSATLPTIPSAGAETLLSTTFTTGAPQVITVGQRRISLAATTIVYLIGRATFAVNSCGAYGYIGARRVR